MIRSDLQNKEIALGRIKRLANSGLPLDAFVRSVVELISDAIPNSPNRLFHISGGRTDSYICNSAELNQVVPLHSRYYVEPSLRDPGARFRLDPAMLHRRFPSKMIWMHEELTLPNLYKTEAFNRVFRPWGFHHCMVVVFHEADDYLGSYPIWRGSDQPPFTEHDTKFVRAIAAAVAHGLKVAFLLTRNREEGDESSFQPVPGWGCGILLVSRDGKLIALDPIASLIFNQLRVLDRSAGAISLNP
jgi:hypothetical protein